MSLVLGVTGDVQLYARPWGATPQTSGPICPFPQASTGPTLPLWVEAHAPQPC